MGERRDVGHKPTHEHHAQSTAPHSPPQYHSNTTRWTKPLLFGKGCPCDILPLINII